MIKTNRDFRLSASIKVANRIKHTGTMAYWDYRFNTLAGTIFTNRYKYK